MSWPRRVPALVELTDLAQTLLDAAGLPHHPGMQGRSLWPLLTGAAPADRHREDVYSECYNAMPWHRDSTAQRPGVKQPDQGPDGAAAHGGCDLASRS